jgi:D-3-phosphoglycerate dehydrogenase
MKVLILTEKPFAPEAVNAIREVIEQAGHESVVLEKYTGKQEAINAVATANALIIRSDLVDAELIAAAPRLKIIVRAGAGYDNVDLNAATARNIVVMNTPGQNSNAVAELALGLMVYAARNAFSGSSGTELYGKKLGIHAYGNVGRNVARIAKGFGMKIFAFDPYCPAELIAKDDVTPLSTAEELYAACPYISLHIPATAETRHSIALPLLRTMPPNATLINTARKEVIHEPDLLQWLETRPDAKYLTDILPDNHALLLEKFPKRYFSTPKKAGAQTAEANNNAGIAAASQIVDFFLNGNTKFQVNKPS